MPREMGAASTGKGGPAHGDDQAGRFDAACHGGNVVQPREQRQQRPRVSGRHGGQCSQRHTWNWQRMRRHEEVLSGLRWV